MRENSLKFYLIALAVVLVSFAGALLLPVPQWFKSISAFPGIGALGAALYQAWRDQKAFERQKQLQRKKMFFNLAVTSHMANVAFDKHVEFCEKYIAKMNEGLGRLLAKGPTEDALSLSVELYQVRLEFRPWLTKDIVDKLQPYEKALTEIGAKGRLEKHLPVGNGRSRTIERMMHLFERVTGVEKEVSDEDKQIALDTILSHLQEVLGIKELTELRQKVINEAISSLD